MQILDYQDPGYSFFDFLTKEYIHFYDSQITKSDTLILLNNILEVDMPATKKKKKVTKTVTQVEKKVEEMSEQMKLLLVVFSIAMMAFAFVLVKVYAQ